MPSSVISAILQEYDITFTVTSSIIRTCKFDKFLAQNEEP